MQQQKKIIQFKSSINHYCADACIVWCFDDRFTPLLDEFIKERGYKNYDLVKVAGGAKNLAEPDHETERLFILKQIRTSINLHNAKLVVLMCHEDCEAYGGEKTFQDRHKEREKLCQDLKEAEHILKNNLPAD